VIRPVIAAFVLSGAVWLFGQSAGPSRTRTDSESQKKAENEVSERINRIRESAGLPRLKRVPHTLAEVQLVCTSALTGKNVLDPSYGTLKVYMTRDLSVENESLKLIALGTALDAQTNSRYRVYADKDWDRFSVTVDIERGGEPQVPVYIVGIARRQSKAMDILGRLTFDDPIKDSTDWKAQVAPACRDRRP